MPSQRFHKAARDGAFEILREATKKDCNTRDDGGMTPTLWAAFEGHIDSLRLLVTRGGDPDKTDYFGNTALHLAAARGHEVCVKFMVKFGCNIWALDIDRHSARELAAINGRENVLKFLDIAQTEQETSNPKKSKMLKERAEKNAEKRLKDYVKQQKIADLRAEKEQKKLLKNQAISGGDVFDENGTLPHRSSILIGKAKPSPAFSDIVGTMSTMSNVRSKMHVNNGAVSRKALAKKAVNNDFKVIKTEGDGRKSVKSLRGLHRDSEVIYVGTYEPQAHQIGKRGRISDVWGTLSKAQSTPDLLDNQNYNDEDNNNGNNDNLITKEATGEAVLLQEPASIFNRPGFGSVAFRRAIPSTLGHLPCSRSDLYQKQLYLNDSVDCAMNLYEGSAKIHNNEDISIGSAGSLARRQSMWDDDRLSAEDDTDNELSPLQRFLVANNLSSIQSTLELEQIDLEALMLLTDNDITALNLPLGPKAKLTNAISNRKTVLATENVMKDSKL